MKEVSFYYQYNFKRIMGDHYEFSVFSNKISETDGEFTSHKDNIKVLMEFKKTNKSLKDFVFLCKCLCQVCAYFKIMLSSEKEIPNVVVIATNREFVILESVELEKYINFIPDNIAPNKLYINPPSEFVDFLFKNQIFLQVYLVIEFSSVVKSVLKQYISTKKLQVPVMKENILNLFDNFIKSNIIVNYKYFYSNSYEKSHELVYIFTSIIFNDFVIYKNKLIPGSINKKIKINVDNLKSFINSISPVTDFGTKDEIISNSDLLINKIFRAYHGEYYTPKICVIQAHKFVDSVIGNDWKEKLIIWDPANGVSNLWKDFVIYNLICSTLYKEDVEIVKSFNFNPEATIFQYDFINDDVFVYVQPPHELIPYKLKKVVPHLEESFRKDKPIIIFMNPPFVSTGSRDSRINKKNINNSAVGKIINTTMIKKGRMASYLHIQFLYRILLMKKWYNLTNLYVATFTKANILITEDLKYFRNEFFKNFEFLGGYIFPGNVFENTGKFCAGFYIFKSKNNNEEYTNIDEFPVQVFDKNQNFITNKILFNMDIENKYESLNDWMRTHSDNAEKSSEKFKVLNYKEYKSKRESKSPICEKIIPNEKSYTHYVPRNSIGTIDFSGNDSDTNIQTLSIHSRGSTSTPFKNFSIFPSNFYKVASSFTARMLYINSNSFNFYNIHDGFIKPDINHPEYNTFEKDSVIYSLFSKRSYQSSLRGIFQFGRYWNLINEFFWLSDSQIRQIAKSVDFNEMIVDINKFGGDRFLYKELNNIVPMISKDAKKLLELASILVEISIPIRKNIFMIYNTYHLQCWDSGWFQVKFALENYDPNNEVLLSFIELFKEFENRLKNEMKKFNFVLSKEFIDQNENKN